MWKFSVRMEYLETAYPLSAIGALTSSQALEPGQMPAGLLGRPAENSIHPISGIQDAADFG